MTKKKEANDNGGDDQDRKLSEVLQDMLADPRRKDIQLGVLSRFFDSVAKNLPKTIEDHLGPEFNSFSSLDPDAKSEQVIRDLTLDEFDPLLIFKTGINVGYTDFSKEDIRQLPGYVHLHEVAREQRAAIDMEGFSNEEKGQPLVIVDTSEPYEAWQADSNYGYPDLQEPEEKEQSPVLQPRRKPPSGHYKLN